MFAEVQNTADYMLGQHNTSVIQSIEDQELQELLEDELATLDLEDQLNVLMNMTAEQFLESLDDFDDFDDFDEFC